MILAAGLAMFAATNVDGLFLIAALFSDRTLRARDVVLGTYAGIGALYAAAAAASLVSLVIPEGWLALLGLLPVALGVKALLRKDQAPIAPPARHGLAAVAAIHVAFGADNIGVYAPVFATSSAAAIAAYGAIFAVLTALWCYAAHRLVMHPAIGAPLRRHGPGVVPWVLIALGVWILARF